MEQKLGMTARVMIVFAALAVFVACLGIVMTSSAAGPALFAKIATVILSSQALGWAGTVAATGSPKRAWRALGGGAA